LIDVAVFLFEILKKVKSGFDISFFYSSDQELLDIGGVDPIKTKQPLHQFSQQTKIGFGEFEHGNIVFTAGVQSQQGFFVSFKFIKTYKVAGKKLACRSCSATGV
jgi:hypothetical protein